MIQNSECQLFETTDILDPVFVVKYNKNVMSSNYVYCDEFERFYFVKDKQIVDGNRIKANTFYKLVNGEFVECCDEGETNDTY